MTTDRYGRGARPGPLSGSSDARYSSCERAWDAWVTLGQIEAQAEDLGGTEFAVLVRQARVILDRRWGQLGVVPRVDVRT